MVTMKEVDLAIVVPVDIDLDALRQKVWEAMVNDDRISQREIDFVTGLILETENSSKEVPTR